MQRARLIGPLAAGITAIFAFVGSSCAPTGQTGSAPAYYLMAAPKWPINPAYRTYFPCKPDYSNSPCHDWEEPHWYDTKALLPNGSSSEN